MLCPSVITTAFLIQTADTSPSDAVLSLLIGILTPLYWYTRQTTTGIHLLSAILFGAQFIIDDFVFLLLGAMSKISWGQYITQALFSSLDVAVGVIVLWAVWPLEWPSWGRLRLVRWGKRERVTRRMEGQVGMGVWGVVSAVRFPARDAWLAALRANALAARHCHSGLKASHVHAHQINECPESSEQPLQIRIKYHMSLHADFRSSSPSSHSATSLATTSSTSSPRFTSHPHPQWANPSGSRQYSTRPYGPYSL